MALGLSLKVVVFSQPFTFIFWGRTSESSSMLREKWTHGWDAICPLAQLLAMFMYRPSVCSILMPL